MNYAKLSRKPTIRSATPLHTLSHRAAALLTFGAITFETALFGRSNLCALARMRADGSVIVRRALHQTCPRAHRIDDTQAF